MGHVFTLCVDTVIGQLCVMQTDCLMKKYTLCIKNKKIFSPHTLWKPPR